MLALWIAALAWLPLELETVQADGSKLGTYVREVGGLSDPSGVVLDDDGTTWALEWALDRVVKLSPTGEVLATFGGPGGGEGELRGARDMVRGPGDGRGNRGHLWIADTGNHRVQVWTTEGEFVRAFGTWSPEPGGLNAPNGIAVGADRVAVADTLNDRISVFDLNGAPLLQFGTWGSDDGEFNHPLDLTLDDDGNIYVADADNHRVQKFSAAGEHLLTFGDFGPHPGFFAAPSGIEHHGGRLYVNDRENHRIQVFDTDGEHLYTWGLHALLPRESGGKLHYPRQVVLAPDGRMAVVAEDQENRLQYFGLTPEGSEPPAVTALSRSNAAHFGARVEARGGLMVLLEPTRPAIRFHDIATDVGGNEPIEISKTGSWGAGFGQMRRPEDAAIDVGRTWIHVADPANLKVETWRYDRKEGPLGYDPYMLKLAFSRDLSDSDEDPYVYAREELVPGSVPPWPKWKLEPVALELHPAGHLLALDARNRSVVQIGLREPANANGRSQIVPLWDGRHWLAEQWLLSESAEPFVEPVDMALAPEGDWLYVADRLAARVRFISLHAGRDILRPFDAPDTGLGELLPPAATPFVRPSGIAVAPGGRIFISDAHRSQVFVFGPDRSFERVLGQEGLRMVEFFKPAGIGVRNAGQLIVMDHGNHRSQILTLDGEYVDSFGARLFTRPIREQLAERARAEAEAGENGASEPGGGD